jgi:hypothetical protein
MVTVYDAPGIILPILSKNVADGPYWEVPIPFEFSISAFTEAVGYILGAKFIGTMRLSYDCQLSRMPSHVRQALQLRFGNIPDNGQMTGMGRFEVSLLQDL